MLQLKILFISISCLILTVIYSNGTASAADTLILNTAFGPPLSNDRQSGFADLVVSEALKRNGYALKIERMPAERALINANAGIDDGDLLRISGLNNTYHNLLQVPEKVMDLEFSVFTKHANFPVTDWKSLKPYSVSIITGWKILERNITEYADLTRVRNAEQLFTMLLKDRADVIVFSRWTGLDYIKNNQLAGVRVLEPPLAQRGVYVYLHKKHKHLIPGLAVALREMKKDGTYQRIYQQTLTPLARAVR